MAEVFASAVPLNQRRFASAQQAGVAVIAVQVTNYLGAQCYSVSQTSLQLNVLAVLSPVVETPVVAVPVGANSEKQS